LLTRNVVQERLLLPMVMDGPLVMTPFREASVSGSFPRRSGDRATPEWRRER